MRRRSTSRLPSTRRSDSTARARASTGASRRSRGSCAIPTRSRFSPRPARGPVATGSRTCARGGRGTRSGSGSSRKSRTPRRRWDARCSTARCAAKSLGLTDSRHLIASLGQGDVHVMQALKAIYPGVEALQDGAGPSKSSAFERLVDRMRGASKGVRIHGVDGLMVRYSQCCQPVPGDPVVGYVTRGRGVSIHRTDCPNVLLLSHEPERRLDIDWQEMDGELFLVRLALEASDRRGLYADVAEAVTNSGTNIKSMELRSGDGGGVSGSVLVEVENLTHLQKIIRAVRRVKGVTDVTRRERVAQE